MYFLVVQQSLSDPSISESFTVQYNKRPDGIPMLETLPLAVDKLMQDVMEFALWHGEAELSVIHGEWRYRLLCFDMPAHPQPIPDDNEKEEIPI